MKLSQGCCYLLFLLFYLCNGFEHQIEEEHDELCAIVIVMRHGARAPAGRYPTDPYDNSSYWPNGLGMLTDFGIEEHFAVAQKLGQKYRQLFTHEYSSDRIHIVSNGRNRTVSSTEIAMQGIFANTSKNVLNKNDIKKEIISLEKDNFLELLKPCPAEARLRDEVYKSKSFSITKDEELYAYLRNHSGSPIYDWEKAFRLRDSLVMEEYHNLTLPGWTKAVYPEKLNEQAIYYLLSRSYTEALARFNIGLLWKRIIIFFDNFMRNPITAHKILLVSGHDYTIVSILNSLGVFDNLVPDLSSYIVFELWKMPKNNQYYLRNSYTNRTATKSFHFKNCLANCRWEQVLELIGPLSLTPEEWEAECNPRNSVKMLYVIVGLAFILICIAVCCYLKKHKRGFHAVPVKPSSLPS